MLTDRGEGGVLLGSPTRGKEIKTMQKRKPKWNILRSSRPYKWKKTKDRKISKRINYSVSKQMQIKMQLDAVFIRACRLMLCHFSLPTYRACCFMIKALQHHRYQLTPERHCSRVEQNSIVCNLPLWPKRQGYQIIGKVLLAVWSFLSILLRLLSCTNHQHQSSGSSKLV